MGTQKLIKAITNYEYNRQTDRLKISYGFSRCPFGDCLIATAQQRICYLGFAEKKQHHKTVEELFRFWPKAIFTEDTKAAGSMAKDIFSAERNKNSKSFNLLVKGTEFQINVWKAMLRIGTGMLVSYSDIAECIGNRNAARAVGNAVAANPIAYLIPCHRVIAKSGKTGRYRWGQKRKKALIGWDKAAGSVD